MPGPSELRISASRRAAVCATNRGLLLTRAIVHPTPFPFLFCPGAFNAEERARLDAPFEAVAPWQERDGSFYKCFLREVTAELPREWLRALACRMRELTSLPLTDEVVVTAQRVEPGQAIGVHSDRPLLGYEVARLVLQLNPEWRPDDGGVLELFESADSPPLSGVEPRDNVGFGFVLNERSYHGVTVANKTRRSMVFNFWHAANTPQLKEAITALLHDLRFADLPAELEPVQTLAESTLPEEVSYRAAVTATALQRWGYGADTIEAGYRAAAGLLTDDAVTSCPEQLSALRLADWVAHLHQYSFDLREWETLRQAQSTLPIPERLREMWQLCLPADAAGSPFYRNF